MSTSFNSGWSMYDYHIPSDADHQRSPANGCRSPRMMSPLTIPHQGALSSSSNTPPRSSDAFYPVAIVQPRSRTRYDSYWGSPPSTPPPISPYAWPVLEPGDAWNKCISPSSRYWTSKDSTEFSGCVVSSSLYSTSPPCTAAPFLDQSHAQTTWDGTLCAKQRADPQVISSYTEYGSSTTSRAFSPFVDSIATHPRPHIKSTIKAPPIPLEQLPKFKSPCIKPAVAKDVCLPESQGASYMVGSICDCGSRFPKQCFGTTRDFTESHGDEDDRLTGHWHGPTLTAGSRPRCRGINGHSSPHHPCRDPTVSFSDSPPLRENGLPIQLWAAHGSPHDDPHTTERETFHTTHSASRGGDPVNALPIPQPQAIGLNRDVNAGEHNSTNNGSLRLPGPTATRLPPTTSPEDPPLPTQDDHHHTQTPPTHIDAADVFLGVTQRSSRRRSDIEDSLERGVVGDQFDVESDLLPWLDIHAFGPRAKAIIVALVLGIVLLGAVAKLSQAIQSQSNAH